VILPEGGSRKRYNKIAMWNEQIEVIGDITEIETIAIGNSIRDLERLQKKTWQRPLEKTQRSCHCSPSR